MAKNFEIDPRVDHDTFIIHGDAAFETRLMNDARWPWIIVVPVLPDLEDFDDYPQNQLAGLASHLHNISGTLKDMGVCASTNVATLSNIVTQMHWHIVGRNEGDPNWPGPVWGFEKAVPYGREEAEQFISSFKKAFRGTFV